MVTGEPIEDLRYLFDALCVDDEGYESPDREHDGDSSPEVRRRGPVRHGTAPRPCPYPNGSSSHGRRSPSPDYGLPSSVDSAVSLSPPASNASETSSGIEPDYYDAESDESIVGLCRWLTSLDPDALATTIASCLDEHTTVSAPPSPEHLASSPELVPSSPELVPSGPEQLPLVVEEINNKEAPPPPRFRHILPQPAGRESPRRNQEQPVSPPVRNARGPQWTRLHDTLTRDALNQAAGFVACLTARNTLKRRDKRGRTYLHEAVSHEQPALVYRLVERFYKENSCDMLDARDDHGQTALHYACELQQHLVVGILCAAGARRDICDADGVTPMHLAAERGCYRSIEELLAPPCPASVNVQDHRGRTPLHLAVLSHGRQLCVKNGDKEEYRQIDCRTAIKLLTTAAGTQLELRDLVGETALHYAAQLRKVDLVQLLLLHADNPRALTAIANNAGDTALHMACKSSSPGQDKLVLVRLLVHQGASLGMLNNHGQRPVDLLPPDLQPEVGFLVDNSKESQLPC